MVGLRMLLIIISFGVLMALRESKSFVFIIIIQMLIAVLSTRRKTRILC